MRKCVNWKDYDVWECMMIVWCIIMRDDCKNYDVYKYVIIVKLWCVRIYYDCKNYDVWEYVTMVSNMMYENIG